MTQTKEPLRNHCTATANPVRNHCAAIAQPLRRHCATIAPPPLRHHCATIAQPLRRRHCATIAPPACAARHRDCEILVSYGADYQRIRDKFNYEAGGPPDPSTRPTEADVASAFSAFCVQVGVDRVALARAYDCAEEVDGQRTSRFKRQPNSDARACAKRALEQRETRDMED